MSGGDRQPDLLASLPAGRPGADPAALEGVRTTLAELRDEVAGLRRAVETQASAPATADALDAWGERLAGRVDAAGGDAAALAARAGAMTDAAERIDAGLKRLCVDLELRIEPLEGPPPRHLPEGVTAGDLDEAVEKMASRARRLRRDCRQDRRAAPRPADDAGPPRVSRSVGGPGLRSGDGAGEPGPSSLRLVRGGLRRRWSRRWWS